MSGEHDLYRRWIDELWCGRTDVVGDLVAEGFTGHWPDQTVQGPAALAELIQQTHSMLESLRFKIEVGPLVEGVLVAGRWRGRGEQEGVPIEFIGNDVLRVQDGKFVEYWVASATLS